MRIKRSSSVGVLLDTSLTHSSDESGVVEESRVQPVDLEKLAEKREEALIPLKEDLADWLGKLFDVEITAENLMSKLDSGELVCKLAQKIERKALEWRQENKTFDRIPEAPRCRKAQSGSWFARDNVAKFLAWCRDYQIQDNVLFETEGLVLHQKPRSVVLCLLEIARVGARYGLDPLPGLITMEREIDQELSDQADSLLDESVDEATSDAQHDFTDSTNDLLSSDNDLSDSELKTDITPITPIKEMPKSKSVPAIAKEVAIPKPKQSKAVKKAETKGLPPKTPQRKIIVEPKLPNTPLNDKVMKMVKKCQCPDCYDVKRLAEGKYVIGGKMIFIRLLKGHVMVRVGGGWDTLDHYLEKHDPCRAYRVVDGKRHRVSSADFSAMRRRGSDTPQRPHSADKTRDFLVFTSRYKSSP